MEGQKEGMMNEPRFKLLEHKDLTSTIKSIGWVAPDLSMPLKEKLDMVGAIELRSEPLLDDNHLHDFAVAHLKQLIIELIAKNILSPAWVFRIEHQPFPLSRIRSYKGVFPYPGETRNTGYIQEEFMTDNVNSIIAGLAVVHKENEEEFLEICADFTTCCLILPGDKNEEPSLSVLETLYTFVKIDSNATINYLDMVATLCPLGTKILSVYWSGEDFVNVTIFTKILLLEGLKNSILSSSKLFGYTEQ